MLRATWRLSTSSQTPPSLDLTAAVVQQLIIVLRRKSKVMCVGIGSQAAPEFFNWLAC